jgi:DNA-binding GntR family transcriptional regulator
MATTAGHTTPATDKDAHDHVPPYQQIAAIISARIADGTYAPGSKLPAEPQFRGEFGVSLMTLRKALALLADQGLVYAEKGRGTYIRTIALADTVFKLEQPDNGWLGEHTEIRLLGVSTMKADPEVAKKLAIAPGTRVVSLRRLITKNETAAMYHVEYVLFDAKKPLIESQLQLTTLDGVLQAAGGSGFSRGKVRLTAQILDQEAAGILEVPTGSAALCVEHLFEDGDRVPVSWGRFLMRADLFQLSAQLGPE